MYILKNAFKSIIRNKGRNILMTIITLVIALSACVSLSIREAAKTAKEETLANMTVTVQLSFDRAGVMSQMQEENPDMQSGGKMDRSKFNFSSLTGTSLTLDDYMKYTSLLNDSDSYYYTLTASLNASGDILPYGTEESEDEDTQEFEQFSRGNMGGKNGMMQSSGDFSLTGYSDYTAMLSMFGGDGTYTITSGTMFDETSENLECIISDELAMYNSISEGDSIVLANPDCKTETYEFTITGVYNNSSSDSGNSRFSFSDPANNIYMNTNALQSILDSSELSGNVSDDDETESAVINGETSFTYVFSSPDNYYSFEKSAEEMGLPENYIISSTDISSYEESAEPLDSLRACSVSFQREKKVV